MVGEFIIIDFTSSRWYCKRKPEIKTSPSVWVTTGNRQVYRNSNVYMMTSSRGNIFRVTGPFFGESTSHQWIPLTEAGDTALRYFLLSASEQTTSVTPETFSVSTGPFWGESTQMPVTQSFGILFDLRLNKRLRKRSWRRWFMVEG